MTDSISNRVSRTYLYRKSRTTLIQNYTYPLKKPLCNQLPNSKLKTIHLKKKHQNSKLPQFEPIDTQVGQGCSTNPIHPPTHTSSERSSAKRRENVTISTRGHGERENIPVLPRLNYIIECSNLWR